VTCPHPAGDQVGLEQPKSVLAGVVGVDAETAGDGGHPAGFMVLGHAGEEGPADGEEIGEGGIVAECADLLRRAGDVDLSWSSVMTGLSR